MSPLELFLVVSAMARVDRRDEQSPADAGEDVSPLRAKDPRLIWDVDGDMDCLGGYLHQNERGWHTTRICSCSDKLYAPSLISAGQSTKQIISNHDPFVNMLKTAEFPRKSLHQETLATLLNAFANWITTTRSSRNPSRMPCWWNWTAHWNLGKVPCLTVLAGVPWCFDCLWFRSYWLHLGRIVQKQVFLSIWILRHQQQLDKVPQFHGQPTCPASWCR